MSTDFISRILYLVLVIIGLRVNSTTSVAVGDNAVTTNPNSFPGLYISMVLYTVYNGYSDIAGGIDFTAKLSL